MFLPIDIKKYPIFFLLLVIGMTSCSKLSTYNEMEVNTSRVIAEFSDGKTGGAVAMDFASQVTTVALTELRLFTRSEAKGNVKVRIIANPSLVSDYNQANGTSYTAVSSGSFSLAEDEYVLTQTDRSVMIHININPSILLGGSYAIGLAIAEVENGEVSQLAGKVVIEVAVKNKYDGVYEVTGSCIDALGQYTGIYPLADVELRTAGANSVDYLNPEYTVGAPFFNNLYIIENISTGAPAWLFSPRFVFNTATDKATAVLDTDGMVAVGSINPAGPNQFTINSASDKAFSIRYAVFGRFTITENYRFLRPR